MGVLQDLGRLIKGFDVKDRFCFESHSFVNHCVKKSDFGVRDLRCEFYRWMIFVCLCYEYLEVHSFRVPKGEKMIDITFPCNRLYPTLLSIYVAK